MPRLNHGISLSLSPGTVEQFLITCVREPDGKAGSMRAKGSYGMVESMILKKRVLFFELKHLVASLERRGLLKPAEHDALLRLGQRLLPKLPTDPVGLNY